VIAPKGDVVKTTDQASSITLPEVLVGLPRDESPRMNGSGAVSARENGLLVLLLVVAVVTILLMKGRLDRLSRDMQGQAMLLFNTWKQREYDAVRREQGDLARREAVSELQQWKFGAEKDIRRDAVNRSQAVTVGKVTEHNAPYLPDFGYNPKDARFIGARPLRGVGYDASSGCLALVQKMN
jgi:predicted Holliday junction resolvase-like endonuclease